MKRPTQKLIAFSTALVSVLGLIAPMTAAAGYEAELVESEYDELIEMRDKAILIKNGNDASVGDDTQLVIIDSSGKKQLISKEEGLSGIYNYVTKTREEYNFISPSNNPYSFNFFDENYRISTESGVIIAGYGDKFALADAEGKKLSDEYDAIYRISDDYFMVDLNDSTGGRKTGLIKADGSVITEPANGIGEFYLCGDKFLVSEYSTEIAEETSDDGTKTQTENTVYKYHFMSKDGKPESETFTGFEELGHNTGSTPLYDNESHSGHYRTDLRYNVNYVFDADCICLTDNDNKKVIYNSKTESFSGRYTYVEAIDNEKFIVSHDNVKDIINSGFKAIIKDADNIYMDSHYRGQTVIKVKKDGKVTEYDKSLKAVTESDVIKRFPTFFNNATVVQNGNTVTVNSDDYSTDFNEELISVSVDVDIKHTVEGSTAQVTLSDDHSDFDFELIVDEEYVDEDGYTVSDSHTYKYVLDADYKPHDVTEYSGIYRNLDHNRIIFEKSDNTLEYVNFADASDKPDLSQYTSVSVFIQDGNYTENKTIGYCLKTEDTFVLSDMNFNTLHKPVNGIPSDVKIHCENGKYSGYVIFQDNETYQKYGVMTLEKGVIIPAEYDSISAGYKGFLATKDGKTDIIGEDGKSLKEFDGSYGFNSMTGCVYDANWNLVSRTDGVTSNIVYNINDDKIRYQQSGTYDEVSYFVDDYAVVRKNIDTASDDDDLWNSTDKYASGIINIDGTEVIKPDASLYIKITAVSVDTETTFDVRAKSYTEEKKYKSTFFTLTVEELKTGYINAHNMTFAKMTSEDRYFALVDGLWGVYDGKGKEIVKPQFDYIKGFNENGMSIVETPEYNTYYRNTKYMEEQEYRKELIYKTGVIDNKGNILVKPFNNVTEDGMKFKDTEIDNYSSLPYVLKNVLLDKYGIQVCRLVDGKPKYMTITSDDVLNDFAKTNGYDIARKEGDLYYVEKDGLSGVVSKENEVLVPIEYFEVLSFSPSEKNSIYVRPELYKILESEYTSKIKESSDGSKLVYVKTLDGKVGVYKITGSDSVIGDANDDGKVNVRDAAYIAKMLATGQGSKLPASADFNGDGKVNVRDAAAIAKYLAQKK